MPRYGNEAIFSCFFFTFETEKFHYLSPRHLNVTSSSLVPNFCNFSENWLFLDSN